MLQLAGVKPENRLREQYHNTVIIKTVIIVAIVINIAIIMIVIIFTVVIVIVIVTCSPRCAGKPKSRTRDDLQRGACWTSLATEEELAPAS